MKGKETTEERKSKLQTEAAQGRKGYKESDNEKKKKVDTDSR
jgi:hypothetical protein